MKSIIQLIILIELLIQIKCTAQNNPTGNNLSYEETSKYIVSKLEHHASSSSNQKIAIMKSIYNGETTTTEFRYIYADFEIISCELFYTRETQVTNLNNGQTRITKDKIKINLNDIIFCEPEDKSQKSEGYPMTFITTDPEGLRLKAKAKSIMSIGTNGTDYFFQDFIFGTFITENNIGNKLMNAIKRINELCSTDKKDPFDN